MITELNKEDFYKIRHLTDPCKNIEAKAIVDGMNPGRVYADHPTEPTAALIWIQGQQGFQVVGDAWSSVFAEKLGEYMRTVIEPELQKQGINWVEIGAEMDTWDETLSTIFGDSNISAENQHVFCAGEQAGAVEFQANEITIRSIDRELLTSRRLENHSFVEEKILHYWESADVFLQQGLGCYAEYNNQVVSLCFSAFIAKETHAIDIETLEGYRGRNYGTAVATALLQEFRRKGILPYWDCTPENTGSIRIAQAIGMKPDFDYRIFWYKFS
ncbi:MULTISPECIES: GNAT family N-acetyltransferase [Paenibacillus]|uniref:GNAT family N-acetyltransferase n=1 Tax=Paenibacillus TaxID=44249 RepID=UPI00300B2E40